jgi:hypothetical protein
MWRSNKYVRNRLAVSVPDIFPSTGVGAVFQNIGLLAFVVGIIATVALISGSGNPGVVLLGVALVPLGILVFFLAILVSAIGQCLKALLDTALNTSPLLSDSQKSTIMLKETTDQTMVKRVRIN